MGLFEGIPEQKQFEDAAPGSRKQWQGMQKMRTLDSYIGAGQADPKHLKRPEQESTFGYLLRQRHEGSELGAILERDIDQAHGKISSRAKETKRQKARVYKLGHEARADKAIASSKAVKRRMILAAMKARELDRLGEIMFPKVTGRLSRKQRKLVVRWRKRSQTKKRKR